MKEKITLKKNRAEVTKAEIKKVIVFFAALFLVGLANANPVLDNVAAGNVSVQQSPGVTQVNQNSQQAIINWQSFNIAPNEATHFQQPAGGVALNRINPQQGASQIYGQLTATGQVILINQAGIYFGPTARVDVGGIIASTSDMSNANFLAGKYIFDQPSQFAGSVINEGTIVAAQHGLVALVGTAVSNKGVIQANLGNVVLASGNKFTVDLTGDQLINFAVDEGTANAALDQNGNVLKNSVENSGSVIADGGKILLSANVAQGVVDHAINMNGVLQANSVSSRHGEIILAAHEGKVSVSGKIYASGRASGTSGGKIKILGKRVHVKSTAVVDVSGDAGGGEILIGGNEHGAGPEPNALFTTVDAGALINADALTIGNGGRVIVWADDTTNFAGSISARGGALSGDGGFVETSGHRLLNFSGSVDLRAPHGITGTLLLDPENLTICASQTSCGTSSAPTTTASVSGDTYTSNVDDSILTVADLETALANASVLIQTGSGGTQAGDITVADAVTWSNANTLTLSAFHSINMNAAITNSSGGSLTLRADNTGTGSGTVVFGAGGSVAMSGGGAVAFYYNPSSYTTPTDYSSNVSVSGGTTFVPYMLVNTPSNLQSMNTNLSGDYALGADIDASSLSSFTTIGVSTGAFTGQFNGQNHTISNLTINDPTGNDVGLFGVMNTGVIENLILSNFNITGNQQVGALAGEINGGTVQNVTVSGGSVSGNVGVGGLIGKAFASDDNILINNTSNSATVNGVDPQTTGIVNYVGGIVGQITGKANSNKFTATISSAENSGAVNSLATLGPTLNSVANNAFIGGVVGEAVDTTISNSSNSAPVTTAVGNSVGGLVGGAFGSTISGSSNTGAIVTASGSSYAGGLIGQLDLDSSNVGSSVSSSYSIASIQGFDETGGLVGFAHSSSITDSYSISSVQGLGDVGGLVGGSNGSSLTRTFSAGEVSGETNSDSSLLGGLVGNLFNSSSITDSYSSSLVVGFVDEGGLVGGVSNSSIINAYSIGRVVGEVGSSGFMGGSIGGFIGLLSDSTGPSTTIIGSYVNNSTDGQFNAIGTNSSGIGTAGLQSLSSNLLQQSATYNTTFNMSTWGIIEGQSYPYLKTIYTSTPTVISGNFSSLDSTLDSANLVLNGSSSAIATQALSNGPSMGAVKLGGDGSFYFLEPNGIVNSSDNVLIYLTGPAADAANIVSVIPSSGSNLTGLSGSNRRVTASLGSNTDSIIFNNTLLGVIAGNNENALYSVTANGSGGSDITLNTTSNLIELATAESTTTYDVDGNITGGAQFNGPVNVTTSATNVNFTGFDFEINDGISAAGKNLIFTGSTTSGATFLLGGSSITANNITMVNDQGGNNTFTFNPNSATLTGGISMSSSNASNNNFTFSVGSATLTGDITMSATNGSFNNFSVVGTESFNNLNMSTTGGSTNNFSFSPNSATLNNLTMTSDGGTNNFNVTSPNGTATLNSITLSDTGNGTDTFTLDSNIAFSSITLTASTFSAASNKLIINTNDAVTWTINSANSGNYSDTISGTSFNFSNMGNIQDNDLQGNSVSGGGFGGSGNSDFIFTSSGSLVSVTGGPNAINTLDLSQINTPLNIVLTSEDVSSGGVLAGFGGTADAGVQTFDGITKIIANSAQANSLTGAGVSGDTNTWTITQNNSGTLDLSSVTGGRLGGGTTTTTTNELVFTNFQSLVGGTASSGGGLGGGRFGRGGGGSSSPTNADIFILSGGTLSGSITGGGGTNTIQGDNVANSFVINGSNSGTMTGVAGGFSHIQNLTGGSQNNTFTFTGSGSLSGTINGGNSTAINTLDYTAMSSPVIAIFSSSTTGAVLELNNGATLTNLFKNINNIKGTDGSVLALGMSGATIQVQDFDKGTLNGSTNYLGFSTIMAQSDTLVNFNISAQQVASQTADATVLSVDATEISSFLNSGSLSTVPAGFNSTTLQNYLASLAVIQPEDFTVDSQSMIFSNTTDFLGNVNFIGSSSTSTTDTNTVAPSLVVDNVVINNIVDEVAAVQNNIVTVVTPWSLPSYTSPINYNVVQKPVFTSTTQTPQLFEFSAALKGYLDQNDGSLINTKQITFVQTGQ